MKAPHQRSEAAQEQAKVDGTYDFVGPAERMKAMDLAMRHYFAAENWVQVRNKRFPGLKREW
ncbi:MAG: hypothetical protein FJ315_01995 [SAR202 cluster bacterium]|nr:hypothetical protein [SAR202 cluster bacterium]